MIALQTRLNDKKIPLLLEELEKEINKTQVVLIAGGLGKRIGQPNKPKCLIEINGKTLIERSIEFFSSNGFTKFVLLVGYLGELVQEHVNDGSRFGVEVTYSYDPSEPGKIGKAKALKHALITGKIDVSKRSIIAFPDDVFLEQTLPLRLLLTHMEYSRNKKTIATIVLAGGFRLPYGVARINIDGIVESFEEKPVLNYYINTGLYVFDPPAYKFVLENVDMNSPEPVELETSVLPKIATYNLLSSLVIPASSWLPINTLKDLDDATSKLK